MSQWVRRLTGAMLVGLAIMVSGFVVAVADRLIFRSTVSGAATAVAEALTAGQEALLASLAGGADTATFVPEPTADGHAASKGYVEGLARQLVCETRYNSDGTGVAQATIYCPDDVANPWVATGGGGSCSSNVASRANIPINRSGTGVTNDDPAAGWLFSLVGECRTAGGVADMLQLWVSCCRMEPI